MAECETLRFAHALSAAGSGGAQAGVTTGGELLPTCTSLKTDDPKRDAHLKSPDFLHVEENPYLYFKSRRAEQRDETRGRIIGDLTIRISPRPQQNDHTPYPGALEYNALTRSVGGLGHDDAHLGQVAEILRQAKTARS